MTALTIYLAHTLTGEYIGTGYADPDPLDADNRLIPAHASLDAPPTPPAGQAAVLTVQGWTVQPDHRGTVYRTDTGAEQQHTELGELPEGLTITPRPSEAHRWELGAWVFDQLLENARLSIMTTTLCSQIDTAADNARRAVAGDPLRAVEYDRAASEAASFAAAGYPADTVPRPVSAWAINGRTAQQAADSILAEAAAYNEALYQIREVRLGAKEQVRQAMAANQVEQARLIASATIDSIRAAVAGIGNAGV